MQVNFRIKNDHSLNEKALVHLISVATDLQRDNHISMLNLKAK